MAQERWVASFPFGENAHVRLEWTWDGDTVAIHTANGKNWGEMSWTNFLRLIDKLGRDRAAELARRAQDGEESKYPPFKRTRAWSTQNWPDVD